MDAALAQRVRDRAGHRCEYCRLPQSFSALTFHIEHVARQHGGMDASENLALACPECNFRKGPNLASLDPESGGLIPLFNPRVDRWEEHFEERGPRVAGKTPAGRATARLLGFDAAERQELRAAIFWRTV
jgi:HNH endonuclease